VYSAWNRGAPTRPTKKTAANRPHELERVMRYDRQMRDEIDNVINK
jgi:hypothetical protein